MGLFDEFNKVLKKAEEEVQKSGLGDQLKNVEQELNKAGKDISGRTGGSQPPAARTGALPASSAAASPASGDTSRKPHPGYEKIAAWMKTKYGDRIASANEFQRGLQLEQISSEASAGLSAKAKKGFLEYLRKQKYEPLLK